MCSVVWVLFYAVFLSAMRRQMSEIMMPVMCGAVSFVISVPLWYCLMFTGRSFRGVDAPRRHWPGSVNTTYFLSGAAILYL